MLRAELALFGTVAERETMAKMNEEELARVGGPEAWGRSNAIEAEDQLHEFDSVEDAYHAYASNVEATVNEWGFDLSTDRGHEVVSKAGKAFDKKFYELTGYDFWGAYTKEKPKKRDRTMKHNPSKKAALAAKKRYTEKQRKIWAKTPTDYRSGSLVGGDAKVLRLGVRGTYLAPLQSIKNPCYGMHVHSRDLDKFMKAKGRKCNCNPSKNKIDNVAAAELWLYADNDGQLYRQQREPIEKNLARKWKKGTYDFKKSIKLWGYLMESAAKKYHKEFGAGGKWYEMFNKPTRDEAAKLAAEAWRDAATAGAFDNPTSRGNMTKAEALKLVEAKLAAERRHKKKRGIMAGAKATGRRAASKLRSLTPASRRIAAKKRAARAQAARLVSANPSKGDKFYGHIGDSSPIEHWGGIVYDSGYGPHLLYFQPYEDRVTIADVPIEDDIVSDSDWVDWNGVADYSGQSVSDLKKYGKSKNVLARASVIEAAAGYHGWINFDSYPQDMTIEEAEDKYGDMVDKAVRAGYKRGAKSNPQSPSKRSAYRDERQQVYDMVWRLGAPGFLDARATLSGKPDSHTVAAAKKELRAGLKGGTKADKADIHHLLGLIDHYVGKAAKSNPGPAQKALNAVERNRKRRAAYKRGAPVRKLMKAVVNPGGGTMSKKEFESMFKEMVLPDVIDQYEYDGIADGPARREAWNDYVDFYIRDGMLPAKAANWSHPKWLESYGAKVPAANPRKRKKSAVKKKKGAAKKKKGAAKRKKGALKRRK